VFIINAMARHFLKSDGVSKSEKNRVYCDFNFVAKLQNISRDKSQKNL